MLRISALALAALALAACNSTDTAAPAAPEAAAAGQSDGQLIREFRISEGTTVRFRENAGIVTLSLEGDIDRKDADRALAEKLFSAPTMEKAYRVLDERGPVPQALIDFDKRPAATAPEEAPGKAPETEAQSAAPLAKAGSLDDTWDWEGDAEWWRDLVGYKCGWHEADTRTNFTWVDGWRQGWYARGYLMAAGFTYGADAYAYIWQNGAWVQTDYYYLQPRHYIIWSSNDHTLQYRRYRVAGRGGSAARTHWGMRWDSQAPSDVGVICQG